MIRIIASFTAGAACSAAVCALCCRKLRLQSNRYEMQLANKADSIRGYELDRAFRSGQDSAWVAYQCNLNAAAAESKALRDENDRLRSQLGSESIFAHSVVQNGSASMHLKRMV